MSLLGGEARQVAVDGAQAERVARGVHDECRQPVPGPGQAAEGPAVFQRRREAVVAVGQQGGLLGEAGGHHRLLVRVGAPPQEVTDAVRLGQLRVRRARRDGVEHRVHAGGAPAGEQHRLRAAADRAEDASLNGHLVREYVLVRVDGPLRRAQVECADHAPLEQFRTAALLQHVEGGRAVAREGVPGPADSQEGVQGESGPGSPGGECVVRSQGLCGRWHPWCSLLPSSAWAVPGGPGVREPAGVRPTGSAW